MPKRAVQGSSLAKEIASLRDEVKRLREGLERQRVLAPVPYQAPYPVNPGLWPQTPRSFPYEVMWTNTYAGGSQC